MDSFPVENASVKGVEAALQAVAIAREGALTASALADRCEGALNQTAEWRAWQEAKENVAMLKEAQKEAEDAAREGILNLYSTNGDKRPVAGAAVRVYTTLRYDEEQVLAWCKERAPELLVTSIDRKRFEKVAVELRAPVEVVEEPRAQIASDLSMYATGADKRD